MANHDWYGELEAAVVAHYRTSLRDMGEELFRSCPHLLALGLLIAPVAAVFMWWLAPQLVEMRQAVSAGRPSVADPNPVLTMVVQFVGEVISLPALASIAVACHRLLLRGEHPGRGVYLRLDRVVAGYAILAFWIAVIAAGPQYVSMLFSISTGTSVKPGGVVAMAVALATSVSGLFIMFIVPRLSLALPGIALGRDDVTFGTAWRVTKGNTWRMFWAYLFCALPMVLMISGAFLYWLFRSDPRRALITLAGLVVSELWIAVFVITVGMLSFAYRHFYERSLSGGAAGLG
jgi:hypothetical protein